MKLFISSLNLDKKQEFIPEFVKLMSTAISGSARPRLLLIHNAKDPQGAEKSLEMDERDKIYSQFDIDYERLDLLNDKDAPVKIRSADAIYMGGGNAFYLLYTIMKSAAYDVIIEEAKRGLVVGGSSAGAIVMSKSLKYFEKADDTSVVPVVYTKGLGLIDFEPMVHWGTDFFASRLKAIESGFKNDGIPTKRITDNQAMIIENNIARYL
jgi:dipeptidase E